MVAKKQHTTHKTHHTRRLHRVFRRRDADGEAALLLPHHRKPFRIRHLGVLLLAAVVFIVLVLEIGVLVGRTRYAAAPERSVQQAAVEHGALQVRSSYGFSLSYDSNLFTASATLLDEKGSVYDATAEQMSENRALTYVTVRPRLGAVPVKDTASQLTIQVAPTDEGLRSMRAGATYAQKTDNELAAALFAPSSSGEFEVQPLSSTDSMLNGSVVRKSVYQYNPKFNGGVSYAVVWAGMMQGRPFAVRLQGLTGSSDVPSSLQALFDSLTLDTQQSVRGITSFFGAGTSNALKPSNARYLADALSPAVVKIYSASCGKIIFGGKQLTQRICQGTTGSGFLLSSDGYIGTNGHVATYTANDMLANLLVRNPENFVQFLRVLGLTEAQVTTVSQKPAMQAAIISKIYQLKASELSLQDGNSTLLVALGKEPVPFQQQSDAEAMFRFAETAAVKRATLVGANYSPGDPYAIASGTTDGFESSDVALLKIDVKNAPFIPTTNTGIVQSQNILVLGFPGDAENQLVDNSTLDVSATTGSVSAIKTAAGNSGRLYQSDADASHGNSGGPAITDDGYAFGLLTYRYSGDEEGNAAKSYIRDVADLQQLAKDHKVTFAATGTTQQTWSRALDLYATQHYSAALKEFRAVKDAYPAHRLADMYIANARQAIKDGKDVGGTSMTWLAVMAGFALSVVVIAIALIVRHHGLHHLYIARQHAALSLPYARHATTVHGHVAGS